MRLKGKAAREKRAEVWGLWKSGRSLTEIGEALKKAPSWVFQVVASNGGIAPRIRRRRVSSLQPEEREEISRGLTQGQSYRWIGLQLRRPASTICREVNRNGGRHAYRACKADKRALVRAQRPKQCKLACNQRLLRFVSHRLQNDWSPEQISGELKQRYKDVSSMQISTETIYKSLFIQARGVLKKELQKHLRSQRRMRRAKGATKRPARLATIADLVSIRERPPEVQDRAVPGHWEGDLLCGANTYIATLVERHSRFVMLVKVAGKDTESVVSALEKKIRKLPAELRKSLTWDRGAEMTHHRKLTLATNMKVYFCDPQSPWQRGTNENTNGLLRQYFPKGTSMAGFSQAELDKIAKKLNQRPRKTLGFQTPAAKLASTVALTA